MEMRKELIQDTVSLFRVTINYTKANGQVVPTGYGAVSSYAGQQGSQASLGALQNSLRALQSALIKLSSALNSLRSR